MLGLLLLGGAGAYYYFNYMKKPVQINSQSTINTKIPTVPGTLDSRLNQTPAVREDQVSKTVKEAQNKVNNTFSAKETENYLLRKENVDPAERKYFQSVKREGLYSDHHHPTPGAGEFKQGPAGKKNPNREGDVAFDVGASQTDKYRRVE